MVTTTTTTLIESVVVSLCRRNVAVDVATMSQTLESTDFTEFMMSQVVSQLMSQAFWNCTEKNTFCDTLL